MTETRLIVDAEILTVRKKDREVTIQLVQPFADDWRVYLWESQQPRNWGVTLGRRFPSRSDALAFLEERGYVLAKTVSDGQAPDVG
jgi:hypothetical protein